MFGIGKKTNRPDAQLPYEVYETVQGQSSWRRWLVRLVAALAVVTLLVFGGMALWNRLRDNNRPAQTGGANRGQSGQQGGQGQPDQGGAPQPQSTPQATPAPGGGQGPASTPQSNSTNNSTVRKPE